MRSYSSYETQLQEVLERFRGDTRTHTMTVLHDDGLYRHLRFKDPASSFYWYDIITWPGNLMVRGDMGAYAFARLEDMFQFFRAGATINPGYWAEKLTAPEPDGAKAYSEEEFKRHVTEAFEEYTEEHSEVDAATLWLRIEEEVLGDVWMNPPPTTNNEAHTALHDFTESDPSGLFTDTWEWDFTDWTLRFLWNCWAIRHAITTYDNRPQGEAEEGDYLGNAADEEQP